MRRTMLILSTTVLAVGLLAAPVTAGKGGNGNGKGGGPNKTTTTTIPSTTTTSVPPTTTTTTTTTTTSTTTTSTTTTSTTTTAPPLGDDPILFVHGWNSSGAVWDTMIGRFAGDGYDTSRLRSFSYDTSQSNATTAAQIDAIVDDLLASTGASEVDVISHSMGGLSSRWFVKFLDGTDRVDAWVSLGGPNHGTDIAYFCFSTACSEMRPGSSFLDTLNAGDETPAGARYGTWGSPCDTVINPDSSVPVAGGTHTTTACIGHSDLHQDATVYAQVRDFVGAS